MEGMPQERPPGNERTNERTEEEEEAQWARGHRR